MEFEMKKRLLSSDSELMNLLLIGESGIGKTLFCQHIQRAILCEWDNQAQEPDEHA